MRLLMLLAALAATSAGCSTNGRMLDPVHTPPIKTVSPSYRGSSPGDSTNRADPYENPTSRRVDAFWP
jgi:hypothetical protein